MIDTVCCVLLGLIMEFFAYGHLTSPGMQTVCKSVLERILGAPADDHHNSAQVHHFISIIGGMAACIGSILIVLGLFQPSSNARKFALGAVALLQYLNIKTQYNYPIREEGPPESMIEMPIPLSLGLMGIALVGALFSKTDGQRRQIVRNRKKAELYARHASGKTSKAD